MIFLKISLLFFSVISHSYADLKKWSVCDNLKDCVVETGPCSKPQAINKNFLKVFQKYVEKLDSDSFCLEYKGAKANQLKALCLQNKCKLNAKTSHLK